MDRRTLFAAGAAGLSLAALSRAHARAPAAPALPYRPHSVAGGGGVQLRAYEYGNPAGPAILFIHGYMQSALSWARQLTDPALLAEFRMVAFDLRGHGMSDKPVGDEHYRTPQLWADDVAAVIRTTGITRPVLVGWSYAGRVMGDYLTANGTGAVGGLNYVAASVSTADATRFGRAARHIGPTAAGSEDLATSIQSTIAFLRDCFEVQPSTGDFELMLAFNMMVPRHARISLGGRPANYEAMLRALNVPVLVTHGVRDKVVDVTMGRFTAGLAPGARLSEYDHIGHAPFWEDAPRFNRELAELVRAARR
jgi:non-heme chloroperoxidase